MPARERELILTRIVDAPRERVFSAWTDPAQLRQWLAPAPWSVSVAHADPRPGAPSVLILSSPGGSELITVVVTLETAGGRTRYTARVHHFTSAEREAEVEWTS